MLVKGVPGVQMTDWFFRISMLKMFTLFIYKTTTTVMIMMAWYDDDVVKSVTHIHISTRTSG